MFKFLAFLLAPLAWCCHTCAQQHTGPAYEVKAYEEFDKLGCQIADKYHLSFLNSGIGDHLVDSGRCRWALNLMSRQKLTQDDARPLATAIANILWNNLYQNPAYTVATKEIALTNDLVGFRLSFWDENMDRPLKPYLAQVRMVENKLYYYYADPKTQALTDPLIEPLKQNNMSSDATKN